MQSFGHAHPCCVEACILLSARVREQIRPFCSHESLLHRVRVHPLLPSSGKLLVVVTDAGLYQRAEGGPRAEGPISITASTSTAQLKGSDGAATADLHPAKYTSESTEIRA